jgi:tetratricopeptide (TPR) repeat protein
MIKRLCVGALVALAAPLVLAAAQAQPAAPAGQAPVAKQPQVKSKAEAEAVQAFFGAPDIESRIKAGEEFVTKYPDSDFKALVLSAIAETFAMKNDFANLMVYGERAMEADPKNYMPMMTMSRALAQSTREFDLDREEKLGKAEKYAKQAIELIAAAPKPRPDIPDEQWNGAKASFTAQAHEALGMVAMVRKNYPAAIFEFQIALNAFNPPEPSTMVRLAAVYADSKKFDEADALLDKVIAMPAADPASQQINTIAQAEKKRVAQLRARDAKTRPAPAPAPAAVPAPAATPAPAPAPAEAKKP